MVSPVGQMSVYVVTVVVVCIAGVDRVTRLVLSDGRLGELLVRETAHSVQAGSVEWPVVVPVLVRVLVVVLVLALLRVAVDDTHSFQSTSTSRVVVEASTALLDVVVIRLLVLDDVPDLVETV